MILVDTSVWIELLNGRLGSRVSDRELLQFRTCGPIVQEVLQGLRDDAAGDRFREAFLAVPLLNDSVQTGTFIFASEIYRLGRTKGHTIRSSMDCLIAAIAIEHRVPVWHRDRDYEKIAKYTNLRSTQQI